MPPDWCSTPAAAGRDVRRLRVDLVEGIFQRDNETIQVQPGGPSGGCWAAETRIVSGPWRVRVPKRSLVQAGEKIVVDFDLSARFAHNPSVRKVAMQLPAPTLDDSAGDFERITRHLYTLGDFPRLRPTLPVLRALPAVMPQAGYHVTATLALREGGWDVIRVEPGDTTDRLYGIAVDLGTTTVVCSLIDLVKGDMLDTASCYNQQIQRGEDVASRIVYSQQPQQSPGTATAGGRRVDQQDGQAALRKHKIAQRRYRPDGRLGQHGDGAPAVGISPAASASRPSSRARSSPGPSAPARSAWR